MTSPAMVTDPDAISAEWLTEVLQHSGIEAKVNSFTMKLIGTGQVGENVRFTLDGVNVPKSVVGKFSSPDPVSKKSAIELNTYLREVFFYKTIQSTVDIATPMIYFADVDQQTHDFVIIMEDLAPGIQGDQIKGCSADVAALALEELAKFQGPRWGEPKLLEYPLLQGVTQNTEQMQQYYQSMAPGFLARYGERLNDKYADVMTKVGGFLSHYHDLYDGAPCLLHQDYRLDNMMFGGPRPLTVVDWQSLSVGCPILDVSFFLGTCLDPVVRLSEERHLLRHYLDVLKTYGVSMSENDCFGLYRNYAPAGLLTAVFGSMLFEETSRGNEMFMAIATRSSQMCIELETQL